MNGLDVGNGGNGGRGSCFQMVDITWEGTVVNSRDAQQDMCRADVYISKQTVSLVGEFWWLISGAFNVP